MSTAGNERGTHPPLPPAASLASADRLLNLWRAQGSPESVRDGLADAVDRRPAPYQLFAYAGRLPFPLDGEVHRPGVQPETRSSGPSTTIALHETALDLLGRGRARG